MAQMGSGTKYERGLDNVKIVNGKFVSVDDSGEEEYSAMPDIRTQQPRPPQQQQQLASWFTPKAGAVTLLALAMAAVVLI